ncbi:hypothetical protein THAOC_23246, partial [Thalassiosira oceanica]
PEGLGQYPTSGGVSARAVDDRGWTGPKGSKGGMGGGVRKEYGVLSPASPKTPSSLPESTPPHQFSPRLSDRLPPPEGNEVLRLGPGALSAKEAERGNGSERGGRCGGGRA